jgi:phospholipid/cholesterol/gamma-HCH transport system substrate-binding protein
MPQARDPGIHAVIKRAPTPGRLAVMVIFALTCFGLLLYLWSAFGGPVPLKPKGYRAVINFPEATQLATQADVRIAGVSVGKVVAVAPATSTNRTRATLQIDNRFAPIPRDTHAILRLKSLLGETYVELSPGSKRAGMLPEGGALPDAAVSKTVELDEILSTFDAPTRRAWQTWMQSTAAALHGRGQDINAFFGQLPGFVDQSDHLLATLDAQSAGVRRSVSGVGTFFRQISVRQGQLSGLIRDSNSFFTTTARRNQGLAGVFKQLPRFERESRLTLPALTAFGRHADPVIRQLQPVASQFTPTFAALQRLAPQFNGFFHRLGPVITASRRGLPAFKTILADLPPLLDDFQPFLRNANPMVSYIGAHQREVTSFFANVSSASLARDVNGLHGASEVHYLRTSQLLNPQGLAYYPRALGSTRENAYPAPGAFDKLASGLEVLDPALCANGDVDQPQAADPPSLAAPVRAFVFRSPDRTVARPDCRAQGPQPGFSTAFPQLTAEP